MNRGSATLKAALYEVGDREELIVSMAIDQGGAPGGRLKIEIEGGSRCWIPRSIRRTRMLGWEQSLSGWVNTIISLD